MLSIPQSTAYVVVFKAYLSSDHVTEATGKTIAITISKNGGAFGNPSAGATNATEISSGWYKFTLSTTDTATIGPVAYRGAVATIDDVGNWLNVVSATTGGATNLDAPISGIQTSIDDLPTGQIDELHKLHGLDLANPMTVTPTLRTVASISQTLSGDGIATTTVTRTA